MTKYSTLHSTLQHRIDTKTKPPGSLGRLEEIALQAGLVQQTLYPEIRHPHIIVFAGDHGISRTGLVNAYPQEVTQQMVLNFLRGGAAINVFCRQHGIALKIVDAGVNFNFADHFEPYMREIFICQKTGYGTKNYMHGPAMTEDEAGRAITKGKEVVEVITETTGCNCIGFGEMGIGNTSSASLIMSAITGLSVAACAGRGAGVGDEQLQTKIKTLEEVFAFHKLETIYTRPVSLLSAVGGFEIAMMAGAYLKAKELKMLIVVDGFIACAALLIALGINPDVRANCIFAHTSHEQAHAAMLRYLDVQPLLHLNLRLGEGTGSALAIPLIQSAVGFLNDMASFEEAGVSDKDIPSQQPGVSQQ
jgi:nicotinate-nucleotide--dimethylbenzimidazole phosphoribosyltransferase